MSDDVLAIVFWSVAAGAVAGWLWRGMEVTRERTEKTSLKEDVARLRREIAARDLQTSEALAESASRQKKLIDLGSACSKYLLKLRTDGALLPGLVAWAEWVDEQVDNIIVGRLLSKDRPAFKAAEEVRIARAQARATKRLANELQNRVRLYEAEVPWLPSLAENSLDDVLEGLRQDAELNASFVDGSDPAQALLGDSEWKSLSETERSQLALDRYWEFRQKSAWGAGVQYERYVGYCLEQKRFRVEYVGAMNGFEDQGIDLVASRGSEVLIIQCKRLSPVKEIPVRENVVAQIYGAALYYAIVNRLERSKVKAAIYTTYCLSENAMSFAEVLGVEVVQNFSLEKYPAIKCNVSAKGKIYHLPFDQQYDSTVIDKDNGEFYVMTVVEAERRGFRRARRWLG